MGTVQRLSRQFDDLSFERDFSVWAFTTSFSQLLLRSPKAGGGKKRVDIGFSGVAGFAGGMTFPSLVIRPATTADLDALDGVIGAEARRSAEAAYALVGSGGRLGLVAANTCTWVEDEGEFTDPSEVFLPTKTLIGLDRPDEWPSPEEVRARFSP